jgi:hypothetical protein
MPAVARNGRRRFNVAIDPREYRALMAERATMRATVPADAPDADLETVHSLPEAPASINVRLTYRGYDLQLTIRDWDTLTALDRLDATLNRLERYAGVTPAAANGNHNGNHAAPSSQAPGAVNSPAAIAAPTCPTHGRPMRPAKRGGWFCPAKVADDDGTGRPVYCRQKVTS